MVLHTFLPFCGHKTPTLSLSTDASKRGSLESWFEYRPTTKATEPPVDSLRDHSSHRLQVRVSVCGGHTARCGFSSSSLWPLWPLITATMASHHSPHGLSSPFLFSRKSRAFNRRLANCPTFGGGKILFACQKTGLFLESGLQPEIGELTRHLEEEERYCLPAKGRDCFWSRAFNRRLANCPTLGGGGKISILNSSFDEIVIIQSDSTFLRLPSLSTASW